VIESARNPFQVHVARVLLLVDAYTTPSSGLRGWDTLARADFLLRYPTVLEHVLRQRGADMPLATMPTATEQAAADGMPLRFQFGPWDTRYYPVVARLVGCSLVVRRHTNTRPMFRVTQTGHDTSDRLDGVGWERDRSRAGLIARHARLSGDALSRLIVVAIDDLERAPVPVIA
jgi:hypothetical protein